VGRGSLGIGIRIKKCGNKRTGRGQTHSRKETGALSLIWRM